MLDWVSRGGERRKINAPVELAWVDPQGNPSSASGNSVNISACGMLVEISASINRDTRCRVRFANRDISAQATVRHCRQICSSFRIGLEFDGTLLAEGIPEIAEVLTSSQTLAHSGPVIDLSRRRRSSVL
jgi:hypothetical protein